MAVFTANTVGNAGPTSALESMGAKVSFRCHSVNIGRICKAMALYIIIKC